MNVDLKQYAFLDEHCLAMRGVTRDYQPDWDATRYFIGGKMFVMVGREKDVRPIISIKLDPNFGQILREQYDDIVPGYYLNKIHWISMYVEGSVPVDVLRDMLDHSCQLVFRSLTKKKQQEIESENM